MKILRTLLLLALVGVSALVRAEDNYQCGVPRARTQFLIVRGEDARHGFWPWHVALWLRQRDNTERYSCGGTLISKKFVLTAAHCMLSENRHQLLRSASDVTVWAGVFNLLNPETDTRQIRSVSKIHINGYARDSLLHDIALLELSEPLQYTAYVLPACLNAKPDLRVDTGTVVGWGIADNDKPSLDILKKVSLPVVAESECLKSDPSTFGVVLQKEVFCAGTTNGSAPCNGDSGGGLMMQRGDAWYVAGIVAFTKTRSGTSNLCFAESYTAFTNVTAYWDWIEQVTNTDFRGQYNQEKNVPCKTAKGQQGQCVPLQQCRDIFNMIRAPLIAQEDAYYINRSVCQLAGIPRAVCCRKEQIEEVPLHPNALLLPSDCGRARIRNRNPLDQTTAVLEYPWMVMVRFPPKKNGVIPFCLGTLLNTRYVLSVAECMKKTKMSPTHVQLGEFNEETDIDCSTDSRGRTLCADRVINVGVESVTFHPLFNVPQYTNDISIVRMSADIQYTDSIRPICLPLFSPHRQDYPEYLDITAWRLDWMAKNIYQGSLMRYPQRMMDIDTCQLRYEEVGFSPDLNGKDRLCALQLGPEFHCDRMAGAPVGRYVNMDGDRYVQFGLWKWGPLNCTVRERVPGLGMNLNQYLDWILTNIQPSDSSIVKG
ncbi:serine protease easter-like [Uranotaenia lowii]|uniref:serine protease easter-like n=1 Tax=Uranotaenia lowii TaxID=190385 RepID=UPI002478AFE0|nr:serine protease easter-like [Uranotaenia lowii]